MSSECLDAFLGNGWGTARNLKSALGGRFCVSAGPPGAALGDPSFETG
jgi:hypothetical protein